MDADQFVQYRPAMLAAAYHITGSRVDAEDVVQECWLRCADLDATRIGAPGRYLAVTASRLALNLQRSRRRRRESYVGPWLPEPVVADGDPDWALLQREGLGLALDVVLSTLSPEQATAFVLREVLQLDYAAVAEAVDRSVPAARQLVSRARRAVAGRPVPARARDAEAVAALAAAILREDAAAVVALLAPDAALTSDAGGRVSAARRPVQGAEQVARFLVGLASRHAATLEAAVVNGAPGALVFEDGALTTVVGLRRGEDGIASLFLVRNPDKLARVDATAVRAWTRAQAGERCLGSSRTEGSGGAATSEPGSTPGGGANEVDPPARASS